MDFPETKAGVDQNFEEISIFPVRLRGYNREYGKNGIWCVKIGFCEIVWGKSTNTLTFDLYSQSSYSHTWQFCV